MTEIYRLAVPAKLQHNILRNLHEGTLSDHLGEEKMLHWLRERFYWPGCAGDVSGVQPVQYVVLDLQVCKQCKQAIRY